MWEKWSFFGTLLAMIVVGISYAFLPDLGIIIAIVEFLLMMGLLTITFIMYCEEENEKEEIEYLNQQIKRIEIEYQNQQIKRIIQEENHGK